MSLTNAQLVRLEAGDAGVPVRDVVSGDGLSTEFYLSAPPLIADSQLVRVGASVKTEGVDYTIDDETGQVLFTVAPVAPTPPAVGNVVVTYKAAAVTDAAIAEACRQFGLSPSANAATNSPPAVLEAAAMVCDWRASDAASDFDFATDGQDFKQGATAGHWADRAAALRDRLMKQFGLVSVPTTRIDGYNRRSGEVSTRDIGATTQNPRRYFYGAGDRLP